MRQYVPVQTLPSVRRFAVPDENNKINAEYVKYYTNASPRLARDDLP